MNLVRLDPTDLPDFWGGVSRYVQQVVDRSGGRLTLRSILDAAIAGKFQVWAAVEDSEELNIQAAAITRVVDWPSGLAGLEIVGLSGEDMKQWIDLEEELAEFAREQGCDLLEQEGRDGWQKALKDKGWKKAFVRMEKRL